MNQSTRLDTRNRMGTGRLAALLNRPQSPRQTEEDQRRPVQRSPFPALAPFCHARFVWQCCQLCGNTRTPLGQASGAGS
jgi:hypothetical protein